MFPGCSWVETGIVSLPLQLELFALLSCRLVTKVFGLGLWWSLLLFTQLGPLAATLAELAHSLLLEISLCAACCFLGMETQS